MAVSFQGCWPCAEAKLCAEAKFWPSFAGRGKIAPAQGSVAKSMWLPVVSNSVIVKLRRLKTTRRKLKDQLARRSIAGQQSTESLFELVSTKLPGPDRL